MKGHEFQIATNPWSHHVLGDLIPEEEGGTPSNKYKDYWGYEISLLKTLSGILDFKYNISNPPDGKWGHIEADGSWSGLVNHAATNQVDFVICDVFVTYTRNKASQRITVVYY